MKTPEESVPSLVQIEAEVMAEGREWTRKRLAERLQQLADAQARFPPKAKGGRSIGARIRFIWTPARAAR